MVEVFATRTSEPVKLFLSVAVLNEVVWTALATVRVCLAAKEPSLQARLERLQSKQFDKELGYAPPSAVSSVAVAAVEACFGLCMYLVVCRADAD